MSKILNAINIGGEKYVFGGQSSVEGDFYRNSPTLSAVPDASTLTDTSGNAFDIGQTVRVPASIAEVSDSVTGYIFYRLAAIDGNNRAIWEQLDEGTVEIPETVTVHIASNLSTTDDLIGVAQVTVDGVTKTYQGEDLIFYVDEGTQYTISSNTPNGYAASNNSTGTYTAQFWGSREATITYNTEIVTVTTSMNGVTLTIDGVTYTEPVKIAYGTSYTVTGSAVDGYKVSSNTFTASQVSRTVEVTYKEVHNGVYAITSSGTEVLYSNIDTSNTSLYVGVVVRDSDNDIEFFIDKRFPTGSSASATVGNYKAWSPALYGKDLSYLTNISTPPGDGNSIATAAPTAMRTAALNAFKAGETGIVNTNNLVNDPDVSSETATNNAAKYCRSIANPVTGAYDGYLGSLAEWIVVNDNQVEVNQIMDAIGGVQFAATTSGFGNNTLTLWWTSSEYNNGSYDGAWSWLWYTSRSFAFLDTGNKNYANICCARPFFPVP